MIKIDFELELSQAEPEAKFLISCLVCPVHKKKCRVECDYDNTGLNAYVKNCCCKKIGEVAFYLLDYTGNFQHIEVDIRKSSE